MVSEKILIKPSASSIFQSEDFEYEQSNNSGTFGDQSMEVTALFMISDSINVKSWLTLSPFDDLSTINQIDSLRLRLLLIILIEVTLDDVELSVECSLDDPRTFLEEGIEVFGAHHQFGLVVVQDY